MDKKELFKEAQKLGFVLFETDKPLDVNKILYDVSVSDEVRLIEGFPVMFANALKSGSFDYVKLMNKVQNETEKTILQQFISLSIALCKHNHLGPAVWDVLLNKLPDSAVEDINVFFEYFKKDKYFNISGRELSPQRLKKIFLNYYKEEEKKIKKIVQNQDELSFEYALSQIFSPKQKTLFKKKLQGEIMTKTEKEYFSRIVKKKIIALSNEELHSRAVKILQLL